MIVTDPGRDHHAPSNAASRAAHSRLARHHWPIAVSAATHVSRPTVSPHSRRRKRPSGKVTESATLKQAGAAHGSSRNSPTRSPSCPATPATTRPWQDIVWSTFGYGSRYAGAFLRHKPCEQEHERGARGSDRGVLRRDGVGGVREPGTKRPRPTPGRRTLHRQGPRKRHLFGNFVFLAKNYRFLGHP